MSVVSGLGCYRATGLARPTVALEETPASGGDRVTGLKATAGPGDFYLGNDAVHLAVDGASFGEREGQFGAPSGGAILDVGTISLDQSYKRVSMPTDMLERLGPVANQDPALPLVFDQYLPGKEGSDSVYLEMHGRLQDASGKLGVATDSQGFVSGVTAVHRITLKKGDTFFTLETTLTNSGTTSLPVRNLGDFLSQHGGGFRFLVPALTDFSGALVSNWGVEIPGSDFNAPLTTSVVAPMVALMGAESAGDTFDSHSSLGIMPLDVDSLLVTSDPQSALTENRPRVPGRLVVGSPAVPSLTPGSSISFRRRLYVAGGASGSSYAPAQGTPVFNEMVRARAGLRNEDIGYLAYDGFGTAVRGGPLQTEFRFERYTYTGPGTFDPTDPASPASDPANWHLERVEWREPVDIPSNNIAVGMLLPALPDPVTGLTQRYRITARNAFKQAPFLYKGTNGFDISRQYLPTYITPSKTQLWQLKETLSPERNEVVDASGNVIRAEQALHTFLVREFGSTTYGTFNPLRMTFLGVGTTPDPSVQRLRKLSAEFSPIFKAKASTSMNYGSYQYWAGNSLFGTSFGLLASSGTMYFAPGSYLAYATRGPLSRLETVPVKAFDGQTDVVHSLMITPFVQPSGWTTMDVPGPSQATTGGLNPGEMLSSALAEGVQVVVRTEEDRLTDPDALQAEFRAEIDNSAVTDAQRAPLGLDPFVVGGRSSSLGDGFTTALFTPQATSERNGGARLSKGWTLADFITQAAGGYTIVHRPRGPQGLFTVRGFDRTVALGSGVNAWWTQTGPVSMGKRQGDFDALELIRAEGCNPADPTAWFTEFKSVRDDWFALLKQQSPTAFTKALGLSSARYSLDTPVGLARTYLKIDTALTQANLSPVLTALRSGAAVASTGPFLDAVVGTVGPGGLVAGPATSVTLNISLRHPDWVPVDEVRVVVNGGAPILVPMGNFTVSTTDLTLWTASIVVPMPSAGDAWLVVEAGVPLSTTGAYGAGTPWNKIMKGIYPIAVTNPIFVDANGGGYTPPGL
ncbi:MAG TPA: hypothetical protein VJ486_04665 [Geothrix sp.]|nr:hypothetical protein [Geothrix sp.]